MSSWPCLEGAILPSHCSTTPSVRSSAPYSHLSIRHKIQFASSPIFGRPSPLLLGACRKHQINLSNESSTAGLDSLDLAQVNGSAAKASGELGHIKEDACRRSDGAQVGAGGTTNASIGTDGLLERAMLLGVVAVRAEGRVASGSGAVSVASEGLREGAAGGRRVRTGGVVNGRRNGARTNELDQGRALGVSSSLAERASREHCELVVGGGKFVGEKKFGTSRNVSLR